MGGHRPRRIVAWAGFAPDFDLVACIAALVWYGFDKDRAFENVWAVVHHRYTHGLSYVALVAIAAYFLATGERRNKARIAAPGARATAW